MFADRSFDLLSNQGNRISIAETLETHFKVMRLLEEWAAWGSVLTPYGRREWQKSPLLFRGLCEVQGSPDTPAALHVCFPASCQWYSLCAETFADVAVHSCHLAQDCGFFVLYLIFTKSLSLMHGLSLSSPSHFYHFYCKLCMCYNLFEMCIWCQNRPGAPGYYQSVLYPKL